MTNSVELTSRKSCPIEVIGLLYFVLFVAAGVMLVYQPAKVARLSQEAAKLNVQLHDLKLRNEDLKRGVAAMESLAFIEAQARDELGMVDPEHVKSVTVNLAPKENLLAENNVPHDAQESPQGIYAWLSRIAQFMKHSIAVAKGQQ